MSNLFLLQNIEQDRKNGGDGVNGYCSEMEFKFT